jgi:hypothetical protein
MTESVGTKLIETINDLTPDAHNANAGTERGVYMVETSLENYGAGRSIVVDRDGVVIAGNKTLQAAIEKGFPIEVVRTDGTKLVVVQREDLDLDSDERARLLAYADNRASEVGLHWDVEQLLADVNEGLDLSALWFQEEMDAFRNMNVPLVFDAHEQVEPSLASECLVEIRCTRAALEGMRPKLDIWSRLDDVTVDIS